MKLKTLLSIKFIVSIVTFFCLAYQIGNLTVSYKNLEKQNEILKEQKELYQEILNLDKKNTESKKVLSDIINAKNSRLKSDAGKNEFSVETNIWILFGLVLITGYVFRYLNPKIEKLQSEENETEKENFL